MEWPSRPPPPLVYDQYVKKLLTCAHHSQLMNCFVWRGNRYDWDACKAPPATPAPTIPTLHINKKQVYIVSILLHSYLWHSSFIWVTWIILACDIGSCGMYCWHTLPRSRNVFQNYIFGLSVCTLIHGYICTYLSSASQGILRHTRIYMYVLQ